MISFHEKNLTEDQRLEAEEYALKRLESLNRLLDITHPDTQVRVECERVRPDQQTGDDVYRAEVAVADAGEQYFAEAEGSTMLAAIDKVKDKILTEVRRTRGKKEAIDRQAGKAFKQALRADSDS